MTRAAVLAMLMASCAPAVQVGGPAFAPVIATRAAPALAARGVPAPPGPARPDAGRIDNAALARDLLDIAFRMESGRVLPVLTRFKGPVRVRVLAPALPDGAAAALRRDLGALIARLRAEAGIDIAPSADPDAEITVQLVPARALARAVPGAACFVAPGVSDWAGQLAARGAPGTDWAGLRVRTRAAIFLPADAPPQEVRDCLHEELGQALGPVGDLHRLTGSVFNDDNFHAVLTRGDMLMLRALYDPALRSGMDAAAVAAALPAILARINPGGGHGGALPPVPAPDLAWQAAIAEATGGGRSRAARRRAAEAALAMAAADGPLAAFSLYVLGRVVLSEDPDRAAAALARAQALYDAMPDASVQSAHVALPLAALALTDGDAARALALADRAVPVATAAGNAALLAGLQAVRTEALVGLGRPADAARARLDSRRMARYGFGSA